MLDELDLPAVAADLPAPAQPKSARNRTSAPFAASPAPAFPELDLDSGLDLPAPVGAVDLPAVRGAQPKEHRAERQITGGVLFDDLDLPATGLDLPSPKQVDLPAVRGADLPALRGADLPALRGADLPAVRGADLPALRGADLPALRGADLPAVRGADLPSVKGGFGEIDLPDVAASLPIVGMGAALPAPLSAPTAPASPAANIGGFGDDFDFDLPPAPAAPAAAQAPRDFGAIGVPRAPSMPDFKAIQQPSLGQEEDPFAAPAPIAPLNPSQTPSAALRRQSGGGTAFGEVDLGGDDDGSFNDIPEAPPRAPQAPARPAPAPAAPAEAPGWGERDLGGGDDMEFEAIPQEKEAPRKEQEAGGEAPLEPPPPTGITGEVRPRPQAAAPIAPRNTGKYLKTGAIVGLVVLLGGGSLSFTPLGAFGINAITDAVRSKDYEQLRQSTQGALRAHFGKDLATEANKAISLAEANHNQMPRATGVTVLAAYAAYVKELRFGHDSAQHAHANTLLATVPIDPPPPGYDLAKAAQAAASDQLARGQNQIEAYLRKNPSDVDAEALAGEIALQARDAERAVAHWKKLAEAEGNPRHLFGLARAHLLKRESPAAKEAAQKALKAEPQHVGAQLLLARILWTEQRDEAETTRSLETILKKNRDAASQEELIQALTLQGQIHLTRSRVSAAEASFGEALKLSPKSSGALDGMGEALFRAGRFAEALARFGSAMEADPEAVEPKIGVAKTKLALERLQEAKELMRNLDKKLREEKRPDFRVLHWKGRVSEALGDKNGAEADYVEALKLGGEDPGIVDTYITLAQLLYSQERSAEAQSKLDEAKAKLPRSVPLFKALGDLASQAGRYTEAEAHYLNALQMDPQDISTRFVLGVTLRRLSKFEAAGQAFDQVAQADKDYPGLSLERAVLFEASGQSAKAVDLYEAALSKAPNDPDLMLRVAAALLAASQPGPRAEELLRKVLQLRQNSAEANHFLGRALLVKGTNLAEALRYLRRATDLDPNRAEYFLYVGWAANEADDQQIASASLAKALDLDKSLADAYWQRGVLRRRQRALVEAEQDLLRALELRPSRFEAHATLAEVYEEQQKWPAAQGAWQKALSVDNKRALWQFRLGKLIYQHGTKPAALEHLSRAVQLASQNQVPPPWMADACLLLGEVERAAGKKDQAIEHLQRFLSLAPMDSPYRADAEKALRSLGADRR
jgi:tetratricopeptide (TPR) repeat protein